MTHDPPDLLFLSCGLLPCFNQPWDGHFNDFQALQLSAGGIDLWYGDRHHHLPGSWFWWGYAGPPTRFTPFPGGCVHRYVTFRGTLVTRWAAQGLLFETPQPAPDGAALPFDALLGLAARTDSWGRHRAVHALEGLLLELADARAQPSAGPSWLGPLLEELAGGTFAPEYAALAARHGMSPTTLREQFRRATGTTPHGYVVQSRLARARRLLVETDLPLKAIAEQLGYGDIYYFSRQFHQRVGVPPSDFRRSRQRSSDARG